jgi:subtilisin family serine protease
MAKRPRKPKAGATEKQFSGDELARVTAPPALEDEDSRTRWKLVADEDERGPYLVELNIQHIDGLSGAANAFRRLFRRVVSAADVGAQEPSSKEGDPWQLAKVTKSYFHCRMTLGEWKRLLAQDEKEAIERARTEAAEAKSTPNEMRYKTIYRLWPDFPVEAKITQSVATIKADAALRSFEASGVAVTWAVLDSGVDAAHLHFGTDSDHALKDPWVSHLHRCFVPTEDGVLEDPDEEPDQGPLSPEERGRRVKRHVEKALIDPFGHGTHVAGIITGRVPDDVETIVLDRIDRMEAGSEKDNLPKRTRVTKERAVRDKREKQRFHGVAPNCRIVSLRVLDEKGGGRSSNIVRALEYIREKLNDNPKMLRVHGVNLSVGYEFDAEMFACGQSPLCTEVNRLVQSGVVVVTAAGNTGYSALTANNRTTKVGLSNTINDPGNADLAITVGSTHRESPHTFGISYFSSKGPTGDGRLKPDLVAPGERIISCAAGKKKELALSQREQPAPATNREPAYYVDDSGTSMAAPHVSGAIAAFLSIRREFIGRPLEVKRIFLENATPLGRERYFEGHGLLDLMRAIQSV